MQSSIFQNHNNLDMLRYTTSNPEACAFAHPTLTILFDFTRQDKIRLDSTRMHRVIFKDNFRISLKRHIYNPCILPIMTYDTETWGPPFPVRQRTSQQPHKCGKKYVKHHIEGQKNKHLGKRKGYGLIEQVRRRKWTWAVRMWCCSRYFMMLLWSVQEVWTCAFLSSNNRLFFKGISNHFLITEI